MPDRQRDGRASRQFHLLRGIDFHEPFAQGIQEVATFPASPLGNKDARALQGGGMELDKFHVCQRSTGTIGERHTVAGIDHGVRARQEDTSAASCGQDDRFGSDRMQPPMDQVPGHNTPADTVFHDQGRDVPFFIYRDTPLKQLFVHRMQDGMPRTVGGVTGPGKTRSTKRSLGDTSLFVSTENDPEAF